MANSRAAAARARVSAPESSPRRPSSWASPGTGPIRDSSWSAGTRSPVSTVAPSSKRRSSPDRSVPASRARRVSATERRSRCLSSSSSRPSSSWSKLDLAQRHGNGGPEVDHPGHRRLLAGDGGPAGGRGPGGLGGGDGEAGRDAGAGVDLGRLADRPGEAGDHLQHVAGDHRAAQGPLVPGQHGLLADQGQLVVQAQRIVGADLGPGGP